jgi:ABC-type amino acid transport system permease subunit
LTNPLKAQTLSEFLVDVLEIVRDIGFIVAVFFIVYAGFLFVTARGNDEKLKTAKSAFLWAIVGTAVLLGAFLFATIIENTVNQI